MMKFKVPQKKSLSYVKKFFIKKGLKNLVKESGDLQKISNNDMIIKDPYKPELQDLYMLYQYILLNKRTTILEFGSGWSSLIFCLAIQDLKKKYKNKIANLRRHNPFEIFILENEKKFLNISKNRIKKYNNKKSNSFIKINYIFSTVQMILYEGKIATEYMKIPTCSPDFIYLDGPDQFKVSNNINGITTAHKDMMPMVSDLLKIEYFLTPGTIIVCDGRGANANFLKHHFKRNWIYKYDKKNDQHIFYLDSQTLGKINQLQLDFYKKK